MADQPRPPAPPPGAPPARPPTNANHRAPVPGHDASDPTATGTIAPGNAGTAATAAGDAARPASTSPLRWMQDLERYLPVKPQFVLWGNIYDVYPYGPDPSRPVVTLQLRDYLKTALLAERRFDLVVEYLPLIGFRLLGGNAEVFKQITTHAIAPDQPAPIRLLSSVAEVCERLIRHPEFHCAVLLGFASRYRLLEREEILNEFFHRLFVLGHEATPKLLPGKGDVTARFDPLIWLVDRENELPDWYLVDNVRVRSIGIPRPDFESRRIIVGALARHVEGFASLSAERRQQCLGLFIDQTAGLFAAEIISIVQLARTEKITFADIGEAIKRYRVGVIENPWARLDHDKIRRAEELLAVRVKGQRPAIDRAAGILRRAVYNLSGAQYSRFSMRPKGVLFFAGPTGVGKTELAKAITELIFGSESNYLRFDMSEFAHEHSDQRLMGAPPGYVGYDVGGELTNSVRQNPFSVVLFDEIEKAHPKILDMFLQILDDGRLTSGRGETVYFSECLIVFTSNLGIHELLPDGTKVQRVHPGMTHDQIRRQVLEAIADFFKFRIGRPEILNRIGENIVVFDFIRPDIAEQIFDRMIGNILDRLRETHRVTIRLDPATRSHLLARCLEDLSMGGRGVGNRIETVFLNPLANALFAAAPPAGSTLDLRIDADDRCSLAAVP